MSNPPPADPSRRQFLRQFSGAAAFLATTDWNFGQGRPPTSPDTPASAPEPWFRRALRWGQVNLTEIDPQRFDLTWWRSQWQRTCLQGVVVNAGGIVAYYPTAVPGHRRARYLGDRDLFGEIRAAAHAEGLAVVARMDSSRADETFYHDHPDWFARDAAGQPYRVDQLYLACVNGRYYHEHIPAILREVAERYRPEGFADNNWNGPMRHQPCFCSACEHQFHARTGGSIPRLPAWDDPLYREWIAWNYERRLAIWDQFNAVTRAAGGPECIWTGMMAGSASWQARVFRDDREIYRKAEIILLDDQRRADAEGFPHNGEIGKRIRAVGGWDKVVPESMALYQAAEHNFRLAAKPEAEVRLWVLEGFAGGVQPWWHQVGSYPADRRMLLTAPPLWRWHRDHERYLVRRRPWATIGLLWSQRNMDYFGRDDAGSLVDDPWNGFTQALVRARLPYVPVHVDDLERSAAELGLRLVILPNLAALTDAQVAAVRRFVKAGGNLLATGVSSLCDETGATRPDFALADLFGVRLPPNHGARHEAVRTRWAREWNPTYLALAPERRDRGEGPRSGQAPPAPGTRHPVLAGFDSTDILAFGGLLEPLTVDADALVPLTFVPPIPTGPVEAIWMSPPHQDTPGLVLTEAKAGSGRVAYLPADIDRRFARDNLPDHGDLLNNLVRWAVHDDVPVRVQGPGLIDVQPYQQPGRAVLHLVNLTNAGTWRGPVHELIPLDSVAVSLRLPPGVAGRQVRSLVTGRPLAVSCASGWASFTVATLVDHDVLVIE